MGSILNEQVTIRMVSSGDVPLWENGPSFRALLDKLVSGCIEIGELVTWFPLLEHGMQDILAHFFHAITIRLGDALLVHRKVASVSLVFATCGTALFPGRSAIEVMNLVRSMPDPDFDNHDPANSFTLIGARVVDDWMAADLTFAPDCSMFKRVIGILAEHAPEELRNAGGAADDADALLRPRSR